MHRLVHTFTPIFWSIPPSTLPRSIRILIWFVHHSHNHRGPPHRNHSTCNCDWTSIYKAKNEITFKKTAPASPVWNCTGWIKLTSKPVKCGWSGEVWLCIQSRVQWPGSGSEAIQLPQSPVMGEWEESLLHGVHFTPRDSRVHWEWVEGIQIRVAAVDDHQVLLYVFTCNHMVPTSIVACRCKITERPSSLQCLLQVGNSHTGQKFKLLSYCICT